MAGSEQESCVQNLSPLGRMERIAALNDALRKTGVDGWIILTRGVQALAVGDFKPLLEALAASDHFDEENDPHGEHDLGHFRFADEDVFWKIDYYDPRLKFASENPADPSVTSRVLTVMLASEY